MNAIRYCRAALPALLSTCALLLGMQLLIQDELAYATESPPPPVFLPPTIQPDPLPPAEVEPPKREWFKPTDIPGTSPYPTPLEPFEGPEIPEAPRPTNPRPPFNFEVTDRPLVATVRLSPTYPPSMAGKGIEGFVDVQFDVLADGAVTNIRVTASSHRGFERAAKDAARRFQFKPRVVDGQPVATSDVNYRFTFELEKD